MRISGTTPDATYVEIVEIPGHPYFLGCQFHPEFKSKPLEPHPLFREFIDGELQEPAETGHKYREAGFGGHGLKRMAGRENDLNTGLF